MDKKRIENIIFKVSKMLSDPSLDMEVCEEGAKPPCVKVTYTTENGSTHQKIIDVMEELSDKSDDEIANFIVFQTEQFMEEIDSVEYSGE